eukprot:155693_1
MNFTIQEDYKQYNGIYNQTMNNHKEVTQIIKTINSNMTNTLQLSNGNILLYQKQLKIHNKNMEDINNNLKKLQINQAFNQSFGTFINQLTNTMNEKYDRLSNCMYNNQMNVQQMLIELKKEINNNNWSAKKDNLKKTELKGDELSNEKILLNKIDKLEEHMIITNKNQVSIQIKINEMDLENIRKL